MQVLAEAAALFERKGDVVSAARAHDQLAALQTEESVCERRLEGVVAKRLSEPYRPGKRGWVKRKNPGWARYSAEREAAIRERREPRGACRADHDAMPCG
jgi:ATP-dependent DNA ligase